MLLGGERYVVAQNSCQCCAKIRRARLLKHCHHLMFKSFLNSTIQGKQDACHHFLVRPECPFWAVLHFVYPQVLEST